MEEQTFAQRLLEHRSLLGLSQEQVGAALKVTSQTVSNWEAGTIPRKARIAQVEAWILSGQAPEPEPSKLELPGYATSPTPSKAAEDLRKIARTLDEKQREEARQQRMADRRTARAAELAIFTSDLPEPLRQYAGAWKRTYKHTNLVSDYLSPHVCARLVFPASSLMVLEVGVIATLASKALDTEEKQPRIFYVVIVVGAEPETQAKNISLTSLSSLLGVDLQFVPDANAAAAVIVQLEDIAEML